MSLESDIKPIVLVCAADNNYSMPLAVTVRSAVANLKSDRKIALFVLDGGISKLNIHKITESLNPEQVTISWISCAQMDDALLGIVLTGHLTVSSYHRLLIAELLPEFDKAIYLDSDMVVTGDLAELWDTELGNNYVLAVQDDVELYIKMSKGLRNYKEVDLCPDHKFFNAGLLVINLKKWRSDNIGRKAINYIKQNKEYVRNDQDGLNAVLAGKWGELHPKWNLMPKIYDYSSWQDSPFSEKVYNEMLQNIGIIHYTNLPKPWCAGLKEKCSHPQKKLFFQYLDLTAWSGWRDTFLRRFWRKFMKLTLLNTTKL